MVKSEGAKRIAAERARQIEREGWTPEHDDEHIDGELALAAICYAAPRPIYLRDENGAEFIDPWPMGWHKKWDKRPRDRVGALVLPSTAEHIRMLEKAGALIAAEIDRLLHVSGGSDHE